MAAAVDTALHAGDSRLHAVLACKGLSVVKLFYCQGLMLATVRTEE